MVALQEPGAEPGNCTGLQALRGHRHAGEYTADVRSGARQQPLAGEPMFFGDPAPLVEEGGSEEGCCSAMWECFAAAARETRFAPASGEGEEGPELLAEEKVRSVSLEKHALEAQVPEEGEGEAVVPGLVVAEAVGVPVVAVYIGRAAPWRTPLGGSRRGLLAMISEMMRQCPSHTQHDMPMSPSLTSHAPAQCAR